MRKPEQLAGGTLPYSGGCVGVSAGRSGSSLEPLPIAMRGARGRDPGLPGPLVMTGPAIRGVLLHLSVLR